jgi:hypothetical protein
MEASKQAMSPPTRGRRVCRYAHRPSPEDSRHRAGRLMTRLARRGHDKKSTVHHLVIPNTGPELEVPAESYRDLARIGALKAAVASLRRRSRVHGRYLTNESPW